VQLLALAADDAGPDWQAVTIGRSRRGPRRSVLVPPANPMSVLRDLADLYAGGLREPLPLPLGASLAYADVRFMGDDEQHAIDKAADAWHPYEAADRDHRTVWSSRVRFADVLAPLAGDADQPVGAADREPTRFGALACRLWFPLMACETLDTL
jgi:exodeoxyribonuclease V gamma subunit